MVADQIQEAGVNLHSNLFEPETFSPLAKLTPYNRFSVITDHVGTPALLFDDKGEKRYEQQLDIYGGVAAADGWREDMQFRYPGQYEDLETGLRYNRFRYYDAEEGVYLSQDPIGLAGGNPTLYGYVGDVNTFSGPSGLTVEVYNLIATKDGQYPLMLWGKKLPVGTKFLKQGDVWKYGETKRFNKNGLQKRYSHRSLTKNNLEYIVVQRSSNKSAKKSFQKYESEKIKKHKKRFGSRPPGNKCNH